MSVVVLIVLPQSALSLWLGLARYRMCADRAREWTGD